MDRPAVGALCGTHRLQQEPTPRERRALAWVLAAAAVAVCVWVALTAFDRGLVAALGLVGLLVLYALANAAAQRLARRWQPKTEVTLDGLRTWSGLTGPRERTQRSVPWDDVLSVQGPQRFESSPTATLGDGSRLELPGVTTVVAAQLAEAVAGVRGADGAPPRRAPPPASPRSQAPADDEGWEGPFHRGPR